MSIDTPLERIEPPELLYHGTAQHLVETLLREGIKKMARRHVHLSTDIETARTVGARHGKPTIFLVYAKKMHKAGHEFYRSDNGVWLTGPVPPEYIELI